MSNNITRVLCAAAVGGAAALAAAVPASAAGLLADHGQLLTLATADTGGHRTTAQDGGGRPTGSVHNADSDVNDDGARNAARPVNLLVDQLVP